MHHDQDMTAAERLEALAGLLARGVGRLAMERQQRGKTGQTQEKRQVAGSRRGIR